MMDIDGEVASTREAAGVNLTQVTFPGSERMEDFSGQRDARYEIMKLTRPSKFNGRGRPKAYWRFFREMRVYLGSVVGTEQQKSFCSPLF